MLAVDRLASIRPLAAPPTAYQGLACYKQALASAYERVPKNATILRDFVKERDCAEPVRSLFWILIFYLLAAAAAFSSSQLWMRLWKSH
jgi:hypothetical protein